MNKSIKYCTDEYIDSILDKYKNNTMTYGNSIIGIFIDKIIYKKHQDLIKDKKTIKSYNESFTTESCKDLATARKFASEVKELSKKYDANFYLVTDGASATNNDGTNDAVKYARDTMKKWETKHGFDAEEDWSKESSITESSDSNNGLSNKEILDIITIKKSLSSEDKKNLNMSSYKDYKTTGSKCFIEYDNNIPVAYSIVDIDKNNDADLSVACNPNYRGKGFAYNVLKKAVDYAKSHANTIYYATKANNIASQKLAKKVGLTKVVRNDKEWKTFSI
jgi:RimJ/RimL family protein N-acetyltransferase